MILKRFGQALALGLILSGCTVQIPDSATTQRDVTEAEPAQATPHEASSALDEAGTAEHEHHGADSMLKLDQGKPWSTDAALVEGMDRIRAAVSEAASRPALDAESAAALAQSVREQVHFLIANCRLEPDADATLHVFIAQLLNAAAALEADPASREGMPQLQQTLDEYPRYFAHPGWLSSEDH